MRRVVVNQGTKVPLFQLFEDLQDYSRDNQTDYLNRVFETYGVYVATDNNGIIDSNDTGLLVTGTVGTSTVSIAPGYALASGLNYIANLSSYPFSTTGLSNGNHNLYVSQTSVGSQPADVMSGFAYSAASGIINANKMTRLGIDKLFEWDPVSTTNKIYLAQVGVNNNLITSITDKRGTNVLKLAQKLLPGTLVTKGTTPEPPIFVRVENITPFESINEIDSSMTADIPLSTKQAITGAHVNIKLAWNWTSTICTVIRNGANNGVTIPLIDDTVYGAYAVASNAPTVGMYMYFPQTGQNVAITDVSADSTEWSFLVADAASLPASGPNVPVWIHSDAEYYEIVAIPYVGGSPSNWQRYEWRIAYAETVAAGSVPFARCEANIALPLAQKYDIKVRACNRYYKSAYTSLSANRMSMSKKYAAADANGWVSYSLPFLAKIPALANTGASITATATEAGFRINISKGTAEDSGWTEAGAFEVIWAISPTTPDFSSTNQERKIITTTEVDIPTSGRHTYKIAVRPIIGGQACGAALTTTVTSGAGGQAPKDMVLAQVKIEHKTYQGDLYSIYQSSASPAEWYLILHSLVTPAFTPEAATITNNNFTLSYNTTSLTGWTNWYGGLQTDSGVNGGRFTVYGGNQIKMLSGGGGSGNDLSVKLGTIQSNTSTVSFSCPIGYNEARTSLLKVSLVVSSGTAPTAAGSEVIATKTFANDTITSPITIPAAIQGKHVGMNLFVSFEAMGQASNLDYWYVGTMSCSYKTVVAFNTTSLAVPQVGKELVGEVITDVTASTSSVSADFLIKSFDQYSNGVHVITITNLNGQTRVPTSTAGSIWRIGVSERGRLQNIIPGFSIDVEATRAMFDCDVLYGGRATFRWYQKGDIGSRDYMTNIVASDNSYITDTDVVIATTNSSDGTRDLMIDLYDDTATPDNFSGVVGTFTLFGRPVVTQG